MYALDDHELPTPPTPRWKTLLDVAGFVTMTLLSVYGLVSLLDDITSAPL